MPKGNHRGLVDKTEMRYPGGAFARADVVVSKLRERGYNVQRSDILRALSVPELGLGDQISVMIREVAREVAAREFGPNAAVGA